MALMLASTTNLRFVQRGRKYILQQMTHVTQNQGTAQETARWVWLDVPLHEESPAEEQARMAIETSGMPITRAAPVRDRS